MSIPDNPLKLGSTCLLDALELERERARAAIGSNPTDAQLRYELMMDVLVELCKEVETLRARVAELEPETEKASPPAKPRKRRSPGMGVRR